MFILHKKINGGLGTKASQSTIRSLWILKTSQRLHHLQTFEWDKLFYCLKNDSQAQAFKRAVLAAQTECLGKRVSQTGNSLWSAEKVEMESRRR